MTVAIPGTDPCRDPIKPLLVTLAELSGPSTKRKKSTPLNSGKVDLESNFTQIFLFFSFDEGLCWHEYKFSEKKISITGLIAEPGEKATDVAIWGWNDDTESWVSSSFCDF